MRPLVALLFFDTSQLVFRLLQEGTAHRYRFTHISRVNFWELAMV